MILEKLADSLCIESMIIYMPDVVAVRNADKIKWLIDEFDLWVHY